MDIHLLYVCDFVVSDHSYGGLGGFYLESPQPEGFYAGCAGKCSDESVAGAD